MKEQKRLIKSIVLLALILFGGFTIISSGGGGGGSDAPVPQGALLSPNNVNLIFVVTPDLANDPLGDINPVTANLSNQGLHRSLLMGTYLKQQLLGTNNVTTIHVLEPMTHLQTVSNYPDMAAIGFIQQFALLNHYTMAGTTGNSFPLYAAYAPGDVPAGVVVPIPYITAAQGLAFNDASGNNVALVDRIVKANVPGFHVFSAPWETISRLLADINTLKGYNLILPAAYIGPNVVYVISIDPSGNASLATLDSNLNPPVTYPVLPPPGVKSAACTQQNYFSLTRTGGINGAVVPAGANTNQTVYMIRHAEAHPSSSFEDANYVGAGQWRALDLPNALPNALRGQISPNVVYSIDPAQSFPIYNVSYVRPSLTVLPYAIANNLPYYLAASFSLDADANSKAAAENARKFFFTNTNTAGLNLSNQTVLLAWEHDHFPPLITHLLQSYGGTVPVPTLSWPPNDYDTIWTVTLDGSGNVTVNNALCEGIASPPAFSPPPQF